MKSILITTLLSLFTYGAFAQIVNIEDKRSALADTSAWFGHVDLKFNLVENGNSIISINGNIRLEYLRNRHTFLGLTNYNLGKVGANDFINQGFQHLRYNYKVKKRLTWEAFTQAQYNEKIKLQLRWLLGTGPRFELFKREKNRAYLGTLYMFEYDEEVFGDDFEEYHRDHRLSTYFSFNVQPHPNVRISGTTYFQPVLTDLSDLRISSQTSLNFDISSHWAFSSAFSITFDSDTPEGVVNTIYQWQNGLRWSF